MWTLGDGVMLVSAWKPILLLIPFVPWAIVVSKIFDKHATQFYLPRENWNLVHLCVGLLAFGVGLAMPMQSEGAFWAGFGAVVLILVADVAAFMLITNRDDRVPENKRLSLDFSKIGKKEEAKTQSAKAGKVMLTIKSPDKSVVAAPNAETPEYALRTAAEGVYLQAIAQRASQVDILPMANSNPPSYQVSMLVDGVRGNAKTLAATDAVRLMDFWKSCAKLDVADRRKKLSGDVVVEQDGSKKKVRVQSSGSSAGMRVTLLFEPEAAVKRKGEALGMLEPQMEELKKLTATETGIVLLAAPLDGGRTTTLYSILRLHDAYTRNIQTVEVELQDALEGVRQNTWEQTPDGPEYSTLVRSILRRDPDVVGVADLPDANTAKEIAKADKDRTRIYVSLRADGAFQALGGWMKAVGEADGATKGLQAVIAQKLIRKLCTNCKVEYAPTPEMVKKLGLPADRVKKLCKKGGQVLIKNKPEVCPVCGGVGYVGQEGVFEIFPFSDADRSLLAKGNLDAVRTEMRKRNLPTIAQAALKKAVDGVTSVEELLRVTTEGQATPAAPAAQPAAPAKA
jgi:general secretion pathway protein E